MSITAKTQRPASGTLTTKRKSIVFCTKIATPQLAATRAPPGKNIAQKDTTVCKDHIFYLVRKTSCDISILWETMRRSKRQSLRRSLRRSPRYPHRQSMKITQVGDCLMLQYVFNCMCAPFQHQMPWDPWRQVASKCTCAGANLMESQKGSIASRAA